MPKKIVCSFRCAIPVLSLFILAGGATAGAMDNTPDKLYGTFWYELEPMTVEDAPYGRPAQRAAIEQMLEEARFVFSGMIYGFSFIYTPPDNARQVGEIFVLEPATEIPWGSDRLQIRQTWEKDDILYVSISYRLEEHEQLRLRSWSANTFPASTGRGASNYFGGPEEKTAAHTQAVKEAIRAYLRQRMYNKPKEISGDLILAEAPRSYYSSGQYVSIVDIKIDFGEITAYTQY